jgi:hypothetical protein
MPQVSIISEAVLVLQPQSGGKNLRQCFTVVGVSGAQIALRTSDRPCQKTSLTLQTHELIWMVLYRELFSRIGIKCKQQTH